MWSQNDYASAVRIRLSRTLMLSNCRIDFRRAVWTIDGWTARATRYREINYYHIIKKNKKNQFYCASSPVIYSETKTQHSVSSVISPFPAAAARSLNSSAVNCFFFFHFFFFSTRITATIIIVMLLLHSSFIITPLLCNIIINPTREKIRF